MPAPLRIAVLSAWHVHAEEYGRAVLDPPGAELVAVWDEGAQRGQALADTLGVPFTSDLDALLAREDLDGVTVTTATCDHDDVIGKALAAGKHVFTEKLLSPTVEGCEDLIARADAADAVLTVSLPRLSHGYTLALQKLLADEALGRVTYVRVRLAHNGSTADWLPARFYDRAEALGGAFTDLGAHPVYLTQLLLGAPVETVRATFTDMTGSGVEDNASVTVATADGAIGVIETGFVTPAVGFTIEVHGTGGSALYSEADGALRVSTGDGWEEAEIPADAPSPQQQWFDAIRDGSRTEENLRRAVDLTRLVVAAGGARPDGPVA